MNIIEKIFPQWALRRERARAALETIRGYKAASLKGHNKSWNPRRRDADGDIIPSLKYLRARSSDLFKNNPYAVSIRNFFISSVLGENGITPRFSAKGKRLDDLRKIIIDRLDKLDVTGKSDWTELEMIVICQILEFGECFCRLSSEKKDGRYYLKLQLIEPDRIYSYNMSNGKNEIREGIEIDENGRHVAYYVNEHPGAYFPNFYTKKRNETRVPAENMIHLFWRTRPDQTRGVPPLHAVIEKLQDIEEMMNATLVAQRIAACFSLVIRTNDPNYEKDSFNSLRPGQIMVRDFEDAIDQIKPNQPADATSAFVELELRAISGAVGLAYETVASNFKQMNFSGSRMAKLNERKTIKRWQSFLIKNFCQRVVDEIILLEMMQNSIPGHDNIYWEKEGFQFVDPVKEVNSAVTLIKNNMNSKTKVCADMGINLEEVYQQREEEEKLEKEHGISIEERESATAASS